MDIKSMSISKMPFDKLTINKMLSPLALRKSPSPHVRRPRSSEHSCPSTQANELQMLVENDLFCSIGFRRSNSQDVHLSRCRHIFWIKMASWSSVGRCAFSLTRLEVQFPVNITYSDPFTYPDCTSAAIANNISDGFIWLCFLGVVLQRMVQVLQFFISDAFDVIDQHL